LFPRGYLFSAGTSTRGEHPGGADMIASLGLVALGIGVLAGTGLWCARDEPWTADRVIGTALVFALALTLGGGMIAEGLSGLP